MQLRSRAVAGVAAKVTASTSPSTSVAKTQKTASPSRPSQGSPSTASASASASSACGSKKRGRDASSSHSPSPPLIRGGRISTSTSTSSSKPKALPPTAASALESAETIEFRAFLKAYPATGEYIEGPKGHLNHKRAEHLAHDVLDLRGMAIATSKTPKPFELLKAYCKFFGDAMAPRVPLELQLEQ